MIYTTQYIVLHSNNYYNTVYQLNIVRVTKRYNNNIIIGSFTELHFDLKIVNSFKQLLLCLLKSMQINGLTHNCNLLPDGQRLTLCLTTCTHNIYYIGLLKPNQALIIPLLY